MGVSVTAESQFVMYVSMCLVTSKPERETAGAMNQVKCVSCVRQVIMKGRQERELVRMMMKLLHVKPLTENAENVAELLRVSVRLNNVEPVTDCTKLTELPIECEHETEQRKANRIANESEHETEQRRASDRLHKANRIANENEHDAEQRRAGKRLCQASRIANESEHDVEQRKKQNHRTVQVIASRCLSCGCTGTERYTFFLGRILRVDNLDRGFGL